MIACEGPTRGARSRVLLVSHRDRYIEPLEPEWSVQGLKIRHDADGGNRSEGGILTNRLRRVRREKSISPAQRSTPDGPSARCIPQPGHGNTRRPSLKTSGSAAQD